jgi:hypothetical protein
LQKIFQSGKTLQSNGESLSIVHVACRRWQARVDGANGKRRDTHGCRRCDRRLISFIRSARALLADKQLSVSWSVPTLRSIFETTDMERHRALYTTAQSPSPSLSSYTISCGVRGGISVMRFFERFFDVAGTARRSTASSCLRTSRGGMRNASPSGARARAPCLGRGWGWLGQAGDMQAVKKTPENLDEMMTLSSTYVGV